MRAFVDYARYYDLIYQDKDYAAEAGFIRSLIREYAPNAKLLLDLGCGSGRHAVRLAQDGYSIVGVDRSEEMLAAAQQRSADLTSDERKRLNFRAGDLRSVRLQQTFDVVVALFHVMSYQTSNDDLLAAFTTARTHLRAGGLFIFDCWYGPGVLTDPPKARIKQLKAADGAEVVRFSEPRMNPNANVVDVEFTLFVVAGGTNQCHRIHETHTMRYLFSPEIDLLSNSVGFEVVSRTQWLSRSALDSSCWNACYVARMRAD
jgi:SAM-dependent methyltransferase